MNRVLNPVSLGLALRRGVGRKRRQRRAVSAVGGDGFRGRANVGHRLRPPQPGSTQQQNDRTWRPDLLVAIDLLAFLVALLRFHREGCDRARLQPLRRDRLAGFPYIARTFYLVSVPPPSIPVTAVHAACRGP